MEFENLKEIFKKEYGKEITDKEFLEKLRIIIDDIDLLIDVVKARREQVKNILRIFERSIENHKSCKISIEERKIVIKTLNKLSKVIVNNEDEKRFIDFLAKNFIRGLELMQKNNING